LNKLVAFQYVPMLYQIETQSYQAQVVETGRSQDQRWRDH